MPIKFIKQINEWLFNRRLFEGHLRIYDKIFLNGVLKIKPQKILDIGCGRARYHKMIKKHNIDLTGIDSDKSLKNAWNYDYGQYFVANANNLNFEDKYFDLVTFRGSFHEMEHEKVLSEVNRVLTDNGKILIFDLCNKLLYTNKIINNNPSCRVVFNHVIFIFKNKEVGVNKIRHVIIFFLFLLIRNIPSYKKEIVSGGKYNVNEYLEITKKYFDLLNYKTFDDLYVLIEGVKKR